MIIIMCTTKLTYTNFSIVHLVVLPHVAQHPAVDVVCLSHPVSSEAVVAAIPILDRQRPTTAISILLPAHDLLWTLSICFGVLFVWSSDLRLISLVFVLCKLNWKAILFNGVIINQLQQPSRQ